MRLFVALQIPAEVREALSKLVSELCQIASSSGRDKPKWVKPENHHVTLKFIGETPAAKLDAIRETLSAVRSGQQVTLGFRGLGFFPNEKQPRIFWAGMRTSQNLQTLAADVDQSLEKMGFARETRPFAPHLTLARFEPPGIAENLRIAIQKDMVREFGSCTANEFHLIESKLNPSGAEYTSLQTFRFSTAEA
jgi:RNA 2',3'-cyclic 3'-phosphodiesterase